MKNAPTHKGFMDYLSSPITLLPMAAGLTLFILIFAGILASNRQFYIFLGVSSFLLGFGLLMTLWLIGANPQQEQMRLLREEFLDRLEKYRNPSQRNQSPETEIAATPARIES